MALEIKMFTLLGGTTFITDLISSSLYAGLMPDKVAMPAIVYSRSVSEPVNYLSGRSSVENVRMEVSCYATAYKASFELSTVVHRIMHGSTTFKSILLTNQMRIEVINDRKNLFETLQTFSVWDKD